MVSINYSAREVCCKIVYYGPGLSGKTTNLQYVHNKVPATARGKLVSLATEADRTLYFDFLPINIGTINGFAAKFQLYTVPGQVYYNATRKLVLRGVDGVVFVADSQADKMDENIESLANLEENLVEYGYNLDELPLVIQYNKRDLPGVLSVEELDAKLNPRGRHTFEASATIGNGVFDTLKLVIKLVLDKAKNSGQSAQKTPDVMVQTAPPTTHPDTVTPEPAPYPSAEKVGEHTTEPVEEPSPSSPPPVDSIAAEATPSVGIQDDTSNPTPVGAGVGMNTGEVTGQSSVQQEAVARPYPGSVTGGIPISNRPEKVAGGTPTERSTVASHTTDTNSNTMESNAPSMAPPLRRRSEKKKRGFFKRLFGLK